MTACTRFREVLALADHGLGSVAADEMRAHIEECSVCAALYNTLAAPPRAPAAREKGWLDLPARETSDERHFSVDDSEAAEEPPRHARALRFSRSAVYLHTRYGGAPVLEKARVASLAFHYVVDPDPGHMGGAPACTEAQLRFLDAQGLCLLTLDVGRDDRIEARVNTARAVAQLWALPIDVSRLEK